MRSAFGASFDVPDGYLNTASIGVPPTFAAQAVTEAVANWASGRAKPGDFDEHVVAARAAFGRLIGVGAERVAIGASASQLVGLVAAGVEPGLRVLVAEEDFTSLLFPFAAQEGVEITAVDLDDVGKLAPEHDLVAVSVVQSADGRIADLDALRRAREERGTRVLLDATQSAGWLPQPLDWADWVVCHGYKWLLAPRGAAWLAVHPDAPEITPHSGNWYAAERPWESTYGLPMRLASDARRLDLSPVWLAQVGAAASMEWLAGLDLHEVAAHCTGLADELRARLGVEPAGSAIVSISGTDAVAKLTAAGIECAARNGRARMAFHLYNTTDDVERAVRALG
ncbi:aminotransferase class V-fold PLP-dependent enzyme [Saccharopolyspora griseoalba]|uniref:Aminotransferase class V-fold PLP-dependent enzyme n=1 Tax=Saccharopolyspora griseoalba TaxID=1431848 RepID=A0ABW2LE05_9PSEU